MSDVDLENAERAALFEGPWKAGELTFRPFTAASPEHMAALGIEGAMAGLTPDAGDMAWLKVILGIAWTLCAPLEEVNDLAFEAAEATTEEERAAVRKEFRRLILEFQSTLDREALTKVVTRVTEMFQRNAALEFDLIESKDGKSGGKKEQPPKNSPGRGRRRS